MLDSEGIFYCLRQFPMACTKGEMLVRVVGIQFTCIGQLVANEYHNCST